MDNAGGEKLGEWRPGMFRGKHVAIRGAGDKRTRRILNVETEAEARRAIQELNDELVLGGKTTVSVLLDLHQKHKGEKWTPHDTRNKKLIEKHFGTLDYAEISVDLCEDYVAMRTSDGMALNTIRLELSHMRTAIRHAKKKKRIKTLPEFYVPTSDVVRERWLDEPEFQRLIAGACEFHVKLYCIIALATAARPSHILKLHLERHIDMENRLFDFRGIVRAENKRAPRIPMNKTAYDAIRTALPLNKSGYLIEYRGKPIEAIKKAIYAAAERSGLQGVSPYVLRHTAGVWMAKKGVSIEKIAEYMGHTNIEITRKHYAHFQPEFMKDASEALEIVPDTMVQLVPARKNKERS